MKVLLINGPNLNLLGKREPDIYGTESMEARLAILQQQFPEAEIQYFQSNIEGELINALQKERYDALVINPGAYSHYSIALMDALKNCTCPKIEVHISNIHAREDFRHKTITGMACDAVISGCGLEGYSLAIQFLVQKITFNS